MRRIFILILLCVLLFNACSSTEHPNNILKVEVNEDNSKAVYLSEKLSGATVANFYELYLVDLNDRTFERICGANTYEYSDFYWIDSVTLYVNNSDIPEEEVAIEKTVVDEISVVYSIGSRNENEGLRIEW